MLNYFLNPVRKYDTERSFFDDFFSPEVVAGKMKTDVTETETEYKFDIELPGYAKENVQVTVDDGYMTVSATNTENKETKKNNYVSRERYTGSVSRSWYVGDVDLSSIKASFNNGILNISVPKEQIKKEKSYISID